MNGIELANYESSGYCVLDTETGEILYTQNKIHKGVFTGLFFKDSNNFFAIYPTLEGPKIYFNKKEYLIEKNLTILLQKEGENRRFIIKDYGIEIPYVEPRLDEFSEEIDVDLFFRIEQRYKDPNFYERYTLKS